MAQILVIDDERNIVKSLETFLNIRGHTVLQALTFREGEKKFFQEDPEIVILDVFLRGENGIDLLKKFHKARPEVPVLMISGHADIRTAVEAVRLGAYDFLEKPVDTERLELLIQHAEKEIGLAKQVNQLKDRWVRENLYIGSSREFRDTVGIAEKAGPSDAAVLITGESGSGKEPLAYYTYLCSSRRDEPFITVNCAALPEELFASAVFGHVKGAFTGAVSGRDGFFQAARKGTLFLDEVGEIPLALQPKMLRALESGEIQKVGSSVIERADVRIIAATNRDLVKAVDQGAFREDLFYRLNQIPLSVPPLESRKEDIPGLIDFFIRHLERKSAISGRSFSEDGIRYLQSRKYKGNIRDLVERTLILSDADCIGGKELEKADHIGISNTNKFRSDRKMTLREAKHEFEKEFIQGQLVLHGNSVKETAETLGVLPNNLSRRIKELGITFRD